MSEINLSVATRSSLLSLQSTADLLAQTQERLATGNRVNSALDDPTAFFTATALNDRASDLSTLLDEQGQAIQVIEAADNGISAIQDLVETARGLANQALQTDSLADRASLAAQYDAILGQIEALAGDASFNGTNLLDSLNSQDLQVIFNEDSSSSLTVLGVNFTNASAVDGLNLQRVSSAGSATPSTGTIPFADLAGNETLTIDADSAGPLAAFNIDLSTIAAGFTPATPGTTETAGFDVTAVSNGDTFSITVDDGTGTPQTLDITFGTNPGEIDATTITSQADLLAAIQPLADATFGPGNVTLSPGTGTEIAFSATTGNISASFVDADNAGGSTTISAPLSSDFVPVNPGTLTISGVIDAINTAGRTTGVTASNDGQGGIVISSTSGDFSVSGATTATGAGFVQGNGSDFATNESVNATLAAIDAALGTLRTTASTLGTNLSTIQIRSDFTQNLINTLEVGAGNLTLADLNEEGANLLTLQTRQQLASTSLSFATQADQSVLSLFN